MLYEERAEAILKQTQLKSIVTVSELKSLLRVSVDTIRRDLKQMETEGMIRCIRGGACLPDALMVRSNFKGREIINIPQKQEAAKKAADEIKSGATIAMNAGTTNTILAQELLSRGTEATVVTNNLAAANILMQAPGIRLILIGGMVDATEQASFGTDCEAAFSLYRPDIAFLSINAVSIEAGFTDFRYYEMGIMKLLAKQAAVTIAVMDSSKLETVSKKQVLTFSEVDRLIMDDKMPRQLREAYQKSGMTIM